MRSFESTLTFNGSLLAYDSIDVRTELSGRVRAIHFTDGQEVKAGDLIIEIDTEELEAQLLSAREQLELAILNAQRLESLQATNSVPVRERDEAVSRREVFRAEVTLLEARIRKGRITAPFDGVLGLRRVSPGQFLEPSSIITTLQTVRRLRLDFSIPERYRGSVGAGMPVRFTVAGFADSFSGTVSAIDPRVDQNTRSVIVRADVDNDERKLLPGNYARVELVITRDKAIVVPAIAVVRSLNSVSVFLLRDGLAVRREIEIGERTPTEVEIKSGLQAGDVVITEGIQAVRDGRPVEAKSPETP
jgi:membrane fusion protein (multidrug efflux system)